jgi:hypothetical protein
MHSAVAVFGRIQHAPFVVPGCARALVPTMPSIATHASATFRALNVNPCNMSISL